MFSLHAHTHLSRKKSKQKISFTCKGQFHLASFSIARRQRWTFTRLARQKEKREEREEEKENASKNKFVFMQVNYRYGGKKLPTLSLFPKKVGNTGFSLSLSVSLIHTDAFFLVFFVRPICSTQGNFSHGVIPARECFRKKKSVMRQFFRVDVRSHACTYVTASSEGEREREKKPTRENRYVRVWYKFRRKKRLWCGNHA